MMQKSAINAIQTLLLILVALAPVFYFRSCVYPRLLPKTFLTQVVIEAVFFLWLGLAVGDKRYRPCRSNLSAAFLSFIGALLLTSFFGTDFTRSFWSNQERAFGVFTILHGFALFLVLSSLWRYIDWKRLFQVMVLAGIPVALIALIQVIYADFFFLHEYIYERPGSTFGSPNYLAEYLVLIFFIAAWLLIDEYRRKDKRSYPLEAALWAALIFSLAAIIVSQTRGAILGVAAGVFFLAVYAATRTTNVRFRSAIILFLCVAVLGSALFLFTRPSEFWHDVPVLSRFHDISFSSTQLSPRLVALSSAWRGFIEKPVLGCGWENFNTVYSKYYNPKILETNYNETRLDKPHNWLLEYLATGGILLAGAYLWLLVAYFRALFVGKSRISGGTAVVFCAAAVLAHVVSMLFFFETLIPFLFFSILLAWVNRGRQAETGGPNGSVDLVTRIASVPRQKLFFCLLSFAGLAMFYACNCRPMLAAYFQYRGYQTFITNPSEGILSFKKAISLAGPYSWAVAQSYAIFIAEAHFHDPDDIPDQDIKDAVSGMEKIVLSHPSDVLNRIALVVIYSQVADLDKTYLDKAELEAEATLKLSPNRQEVLYSLARAKSLKGDKAAALAIAKQALDLDAQVADSHFYYGLLAAEANLAELAYREIKTAMAMERGWKNHHEPRIVASFFAETGHMEDAIALFKIALKMNPGDLEAKIKLGISYYLIGQMNKAKLFLSAARKRYDFKTSPNYGSLKPILDDLQIQP